MSEEDVVTLVMELRSAYRMARAAEDRRTAAEEEVRVESKAAREAWDEVYRLQGLLQGGAREMVNRYDGSTP